MAESNRQRRSFPDAFKLETVAAIQGGRSVTAVAAELGLPDRLVRAWLRWAEGRTAAGSGTPAPKPRKEQAVPARRIGPSPAKAELTLRDVAEQGEWVLREPGSGTRSAFEAALAAAGIPPSRLRITLELPSNEAVRAAVESGMGATVISASVAVSGLEAGLLHRVALALPEREFHVLRHRERHSSRAAEALLSLIAATTPRPDPVG
jgi:transposase-like protein